MMRNRSRPWFVGAVAGPAAAVVASEHPNDQAEGTPMSRQASDLESARPQPPMGAPSRAGVSLPAAPSPGEYVRILVIAALLGAPVAVAAALFMSLSHGLTTLVWTTIPDRAGWTALPWWYVLAVPATAGLLVAAAVRLPGRRGEPGVARIGLDPLSPIQLPNALLAALGRRREHPHRGHRLGDRLAGGHRPATASHPTPVRSSTGQLMHPGSATT
jgi:hypothetical protein